MSAYTLRLHYMSGIDPTTEALDAVDETEARELARVRLLLTRDYSHVELHRGGEALHVFSRD
jgi:hypothetical protein